MSLGATFAASPRRQPGPKTLLGTIAKGRCLCPIVRSSFRVIAAAVALTLPRPRQAAVAAA
jgi:hypothetical protein